VNTKKDSIEGRLNKLIEVEKYSTNLHR